MNDEPKPKTKAEWLELCRKQMKAAIEMGRRDLAGLFWVIAVEWGLYD